MKVAITGSSGLIGTALGQALGRGGHQAVAVVRTAPEPGEIGWDPAAGTIDAAGLADVDAVVNLAGPGIGDRRWTKEYKRELRDARVKATTLIATTMAAADNGPRILVSASGVDYYPADSNVTFDESAAPGDGFLAQLCVDWEASTAAAAAAGHRVAIIRTGTVLAAEGGALARMLPLFKLGLGGRFGSGRQWQSWISIDDHVAAIVHLLEGDASGPVNSVAPNPVTNRELTATLGDVLNRPTLLPIPKFAPSLVFGGELVDALLYSGRRVAPTVLEADGFEFRHPTLEVALRAVLKRPKATSP